MQLYLVAGMHRSGTSLLTMLASVVGAAVGPEEAHIGASESNPTGHWELRPLVELNDRLLAAMGGTWDDPPPLPQGWEHDERVRHLRSEAMAILREHLPADGRSVVKDPRLSVLAPFWQSLIPVRATIVMLRAPGEVAGSLARRNGIGPTASAELWVRYTLDALELCANPVLVSYDELLDDRRGAAVAKLLDVLDLPPLTAEQEAAVASSIRPDLRRQTDQGTLPGAAGVAAQALYRELHDGDASAVAAFGPALRERAQLRGRTASLRAEAARCDDVLQRERQRIEQATTTALTFRALHRAGQRELAALHRQARLLQRDALRMERQRTTLEVQGTQLRERLEEQHVQGQRLRDELDRARSRAARQEREDAERTRQAEARAVEMASQVREHEQLAEDRQQALDEVRVRLAAAEESYRRLRTRRLVRFALRVAALARPLLRLARR